MDIGAQKEKKPTEVDQLKTRRMQGEGPDESPEEPEPGIGTPNGQAERGGKETT